MNSDCLYEQFKRKQQEKHLLEHYELERIRSMSSGKKTNMTSTRILNQKFISQLQQFPDEDTINLQSSIPLLHSVRVLKVLTCIEEAKQKMQSGQAESSRLKSEARFVYFLWRMIDEESIETRQFKQILIILYQKQHKMHELFEVLYETFKNKEDINELVNAWRTLNQDKHYYCSKKTDDQKQNHQFGQPDGFLSLQKTQEQMANPHYKHYQLSKGKTKELVDRLYRPECGKLKEAKKRQQQEKKLQKELQACTFKPQLRNKSRGRSLSNKQIKGYEKTVERLRIANEQSEKQKKLRQYRGVGENYQKIKQKGINPPKFLLRKKKEEDDALFIIEFDLGRHKVKVKVRPNDTSDTIARKLCQIYCLKSEYYEKICEIVRVELEQYYREQEQLDC